MLSLEYRRKEETPMNKNLELGYVKQEEMEALNTFELPEEQLQFTSLPQKYEREEEGQHRIVIRKNGKPVGFLLLYTSDFIYSCTDNPRALLLKALSINRQEQGKGYAGKAMEQLKTFAAETFPGRNEIVLTVNRRNTSAQRLYEKAGFHDTGRRRTGPAGEQYVMSLSLETEKAGSN
jgi:RimJ/RimL family protein N-acetyltransferase